MVLCLVVAVTFVSLTNVIKTIAMLILPQVTTATEYTKATKILGQPLQGLLTEIALKCLNMRSMKLFGDPSYI